MHSLSRRHTTSSLFLAHPFFVMASIAWAIAFSLAVANAVPASTPLGSLYAYGSGISGLPIFYSDGMDHLAVVSNLSS